MGDLGRRTRRGVERDGGDRTVSSGSTRRKKERIRPLRIVSFECDLDPLRLAVKNPSRFPHVRHGAPHELLKSGRWEHRSGLLHGNFAKAIFSRRIRSASAPDVIFYDPFSYKTDSALWTAATFARVFEQCSVEASRALHVFGGDRGARGVVERGLFRGRRSRHGSESGHDGGFHACIRCRKASAGAAIVGARVARAVAAERFEVSRARCRSRSDRDSSAASKRIRSSRRSLPLGRPGSLTRPLDRLRTNRAGRRHRPTG